MTFNSSEFTIMQGTSDNINIQKQSRFPFHVDLKVPLSQLIIGIPQKLDLSQDDSDEEERPGIPPWMKDSYERRLQKQREIQEKSPFPHIRGEKLLNGHYEMDVFQNLPATDLETIFEFVLELKYPSYASKTLDMLETMKALTITFKKPAPRKGALKVKILDLAAVQKVLQEKRQSYLKNNKN